MKRFFNKMNTVVILTVIIILSALSGITVEAISTPQNEDAGTATELESESELAQALASTRLDYSAHVSYLGWQPDVLGGQVAGTTGEGLSLEALKIHLENSMGINTGDVEYTLHCQNIGWTPVVKNGEVAGTTGEGLQAQAVCIALKGKIGEMYDIYYRVHAANFGWLDWASNGNIAGTTGLDTRAEAIEIQLVKKGEPAPGPTDRASIDPGLLSQEGGISYYTLNGDNWQGAVSNNEIAGTTGTGTPIRGIAINTETHDPGSWIEYVGYFSNVGWTDQTCRDSEQLTAGGEQLESICIALKGLDEYAYDLYYQVHVSNLGWLGWAKGGEIAGSSGGGCAIEAIRIMMVPRGSESPQPLGNAYQEIVRPPEGWQWPLNGYGPDCISSGFGWRDGRMHDGCDIIAPGGTPIQAAKSGTVVVAGWYYGYGQCVVIVNDTGEKVYYAHMSSVGTSVGAHVSQGQTIGLVGCTGNATCNHLHLGVVVGGNWVDPLSVF